MRPSNFLNSLSIATLANSLPTSSRNSSGYAVSTPPLDTPWTYQVGTNPWPQYPRPQRQREKWQNLNGIWAYENATSLDALDNPPFNQTLSKPILVPSCIESGLSGVQGRFALYSWYSTSFEVPSDWSGQQVLLNFGAVDYEATVFVNGHNATFHRGGYFSFEVDITDYLNGGNNELLVFTHDPTDSDPYVIPIGKQTLHQSHIFYTPCSGIWQSVWIEAAPVNYITDLHLSADMHGQVNATVSTLQSSATPAEICIYDRSSGQELARHTCTANSPCLFSVPSPKLWSPDTPNLYDIKVQMGQDSISSYTGFRSIGRAVVNGVVRPLLNGDFFFQFGTLDQGFWPDGIYTPPSLEAMVYDLKMLKKLGFNGVGQIKESGWIEELLIFSTQLRKHIKVENALYYQACDELGLLLLQDMPAMRPLQTKTFSNCTVAPILPDTNQQAEFQRQLEMLIIQQRNFPSIGTWIIYNEGWGQLAPPEAPYFPEFGLTDLVRQLDPTRLVNSNTGWYVVDLPNAIAPELETLADWSESPFYRYDHGAGDYSDNHHYANPQCGSPCRQILTSNTLSETWADSDDQRFKSTPFSPARTIPLASDFKVNLVALAIMYLLSSMP